MTAPTDLIACPEKARHLVQALLTDPFPLDTSPLSLHPICVLLRSDPLAACQLLLHTPTLTLLTTLPTIIRSHILLVLHHTLSSLQTSTGTFKSFACSALAASQIPTFALILSCLPEHDRNEIVGSSTFIISNENIVVWLNSFCDSPSALCSSLLSLLHSAVLKVYDSLPAADYIPLLQNILQMIQHVQRVDGGKCSDWSQLVRDVFRLCPASSLPDLCFITETALSYQPVLYEAISRDFQQIQSLSASDLILLMCLCCSRPYIDAVLSPIFKLISTRVPSCQVWKDAIRCQGHRAALLNSWSEIWLEGNQETAEIGSGILHQLFSEVEHSRQDILQLILISITEYEGQQHIQNRYISLLSKLPVHHLISFTSTIVDFFRYAGNLNPEPARYLLLALLPIVHLSNTALDQLILLFRKFILSRVPAERSLGAFGLCELLRTAGSSLSLSVQLEIVSCIESSLNLSPQQRSMVYSSLMLALSSTSLRLHQESYNALYKVLDRRLRKLVSPDQGRRSFPLNGYVNVQDKNAQYQDNIAVLIVCHVLTMPHVVPKPAFRIVDCLFVNPTAILTSLLTSSRQQIDIKNLLISVSFADACEHLAQLIALDESLITYMTSKQEHTPSALSIYLIELSAYIRQVSADLVRNDPSLKRLLSARPDVKTLSSQFCLELLSDDSISCLPLSHLIANLSASIINSGVNLRTITDMSASATSSSSSSSSSSDVVTQTAILRVCSRLFISSLPWVEDNRLHCSSIFKYVSARCDIDIDDDSLPPYRHQLLNLIGSSISAARGIRHLTRICRFPIETIGDGEHLQDHDDELDALDQMALSWSYAMQAEFAVAIEVPLALAYVRLLEAVMKHISEAAQKVMANVLLKLLGAYRISNASLIKAMVKLVIALHSGQAELLMKRTDRILLGSESCRLAVYDAIMSYSIESLCTCSDRLRQFTIKKLAVTSAVLKSLQEAAVLSCSESERSLAICLWFINSGKNIVTSAKLRSRLASVINRLFMAGHALIMVLSRFIAAVENDDLPDELESFAKVEACLVFMTDFVASIKPATDWINGIKGSLPSKLLSSAIFQISIFEQAAAAMVRSHRRSVASDRLESIADSLRLIADQPDQINENVSLISRKRPRRGHKQQHRSRVAYIDEALLEDEGCASDAYADLEDWIVD